MRFLLLLAAATATMAGVELKPVTAVKVKPSGPYNPGVWAGDSLYVSGQGARDGDGKLPDGIEAQTRQCLDNLKAIVEAAGLTIDHVVSVQVYLSDMKTYEKMNQVFVEYFAKNPPARSTIGVARMPNETPVEISAVAVRNLRSKKGVTVPGAKGPASLGVQVGNAFYLSGLYGREPNRAVVPEDPRVQLDYLVSRAKEVLRHSGLDLRNLVAANLFISRRLPIDVVRKIMSDLLPDEAAITLVQTNELPSGADLELSGVAGKGMKRFGKCTNLDGTIYCRGRSGSIQQLLKDLKTDLDAAKSTMSRVVATTVYIDDVDNFAAMNKVYATFFGAIAPTRSTVQPLPKAAGKQNQISLIAVQ